MAYTVQIVGSNSHRSWATFGDTAFSALVFRAISAPVRVGEPPNEFEPAPVAVFATEAEANAVGLACRWANQTYRVIRTKNQSQVNASAMGKVIACQDEVARAFARWA